MLFYNFFSNRKGGIIILIFRFIAFHITTLLVFSQFLVPIRSFESFRAKLTNSWLFKTHFQLSVRVKISISLSLNCKNRQKGLALTLITEKLLFSWQIFDCLTVTPSIYAIIIITIPRNSLKSGSDIWLRHYNYGIYRVLAVRIFHLLVAFFIKVHQCFKVLLSLGTSKNSTMNTTAYICKKLWKIVLWVFYNPDTW